MTVTGQRTVDEVLGRARARLDRLTPRAAYEAVRAGALLVDIRPRSNRVLRVFRSPCGARHR